MDQPTIKRDNIKAPRGRRPLPPDAVRTRAQIYLNAAEMQELTDVGGETPSESVQILLAERRERQGR